MANPLTFRGHLDFMAMVSHLSYAFVTFQYML